MTQPEHPDSDPDIGDHDVPQQESIDSQGSDVLEPLADSPAMAELATEKVDQGNFNPYLDEIPGQITAYPTTLNDDFKNLAATGGAVGGLILGIWSIICAMITVFAFINAGLAIALGCYGLGSSRKKMAAFGIVLGIAGLLMSFMEIGEWIGNSIQDAESIDDI